MTILERLETMSASKVASSLGMSKTRLNYHLVKWQKLDVIKKVGYGTWEVDKSKRHLVLEQTKRGRNTSKHVQIKDPGRSSGGGGSVSPIWTCLPPVAGAQDSVASHGFMFVLRLPTLTRWNQRGRREYLAARGIGFAVIPQGERLEVLGWKVHLTSSSLVGYAPKGKRWAVSTAEAGFREGFYEFLRVVKRVESLLGVSFQMGGRYKIKTSREHHALVENALAAQYTRAGEKLFLRDDRGLWGLIDASFLPGEFETVRAGVDGRSANRKVQDFFNGVKDTGVTPQGLLGMILGLTENAQVFGEHMRTHVAVMQEIDKTLKKLNKWMEDRK